MQTCMQPLQHSVHLTRCLRCVCLGCVLLRHTLLCSCLSSNMPLEFLDLCQETCYVDAFYYGCSFTSQQLCGERWEITVEFYCHKDNDDTLLISKRMCWESVNKYVHRGVYVWSCDINRWTFGATPPPQAWKKRQKQQLKKNNNNNKMWFM